MNHITALYGIPQTGTVVKAVAKRSSVEASIVKVSAPILLHCYPPLVLPNGGAYTGRVVVAIKTSQPNSTIYYTLDGSKPTLASRVYVPPLTLVQTGSIVSAVEVDDSNDGTGTCAMSPVQVSGAFRIKTELPVIAPNGGNFLLGAATPNTVAITASPGAMIYYFVQVGDEIPKTMAQFELYQAPIKIVRTDSIVRAVAKSGGMDMSDVLVSSAFTILPEAPTITVPSGVSIGQARVDMSSSTPGAVLYYTLDSTTPTTRSPKYDPALGVIVTQTRTVVKAIAATVGSGPSAVAASPQVLVACESPSITPDGGLFVDYADGMLRTGVAGASVHFTDDGSEPTATSAIFEFPIRMEKTGTVIKAVTTHPLLDMSAVTVSQVFTVQAAKPRMQPNAGTFEEEAKISITTATPGAEIHCTLDGSPATKDSPVCVSPVTVSSTGTSVNAVATKEGLEVSDAAALASPIIIKAAPPVLTPDSGTFTTSASVVMTCTEPGCPIHYLIGSASSPFRPTLASALYTEPAQVGKRFCLRASFCVCIEKRVKADLTGDFSCAGDERRHASPCNRGCSEHGALVFHDEQAD